MGKGKHGHLCMQRLCMGQLPVTIDGLFSLLDAVHVVSECLVMGIVSMVVHGVGRAEAFPAAPSFLPDHAHTPRATTSLN